MSLKNYGFRGVNDIDLDELEATMIRHIQSGTMKSVKSFEDLYPDPVDRIEYLFGPEDNPSMHTASLPAYQHDWDVERLEIATNPKYIDRCRDSYAFRDLLGREYKGVVFK